MATILPKEVKRQFFSSSDHYKQYRKRWSWLVNSSDHAALGPEHFLLHLVLMGQDWRLGFSSFVNPTKIANGHWGKWGARIAYERLQKRNEVAKEKHPLAVYDGLVTDEMCKEALRILPRGLACGATRILEGVKDDPYSPVEGYNLTPEQEAQADYDAALRGYLSTLRLHRDDYEREILLFELSHPTLREQERFHLLHQRLCDRALEVKEEIRAMVQELSK